VLPVSFGSLRSNWEEGIRDSSQNWDHQAEKQTFNLQSLSCPISILISTTALAGEGAD
jgi:hypothetical protein